jgi:hypothetical protein
MVAGIGTVSVPTAQSLTGLTGIPSSESVGTPIITIAANTLHPSGIGSTEAVGTPTFLFSVIILPSGIASTATAGTPSLIVPIILMPSGIASGETLGIVRLIPIGILGIPSSESLGQPTLGGAVTILPNWYVSSENYAALPRFQTIFGYQVGDLITPTAPVDRQKNVYRCITAGVSGATEPTWDFGIDRDTTTGAATFRNVTGRARYGWIAASGDYPTIAGALFKTGTAPGDIVFVASDHHEIQATSAEYGMTGAIFSNGQYGLLRLLSVNRNTIQLTPGAIFEAINGQQITIGNECEIYHEGITFLVSTPTSTAISCGNSVVGYKSYYFKNCIIQTQGTNYQMISENTVIILDNTPLLYSNPSQNLGFTNSDVLWLNTPHPFAGGLVPTILFDMGLGIVMASITLRGLDLTPMTGTLVRGGGGHKYLFENCKINPHVVRYDITDLRNLDTTADEIVLLNCDDGTHTVSELWTPMGSVTTEFGIVLAATDYGGSYSHKMTSSAAADKFVAPLCGFWLDFEYPTTGKHTLIIQMVGSTTLKDDEVSLWVEYQGGDGHNLFAKSLITPLTPPSALPLSFYEWTSYPSTPVRHELRAPFTPQHRGRVRCQVRLGKPSTTLYYDPFVIVGP